MRGHAARDDQWMSDGLHGSSDPQHMDSLTDYPIHEDGSSSPETPRKPRNTDSTATGSHYSKHNPIERDIDAQAHTPRNYGTETVIYMNGEALSRPLRMPTKYKKLSILLVLAAVLIGAGFLAIFFDKTYNEPIRQAQAMEERLDKEVSLNLPDLASFITMDDATVVATLEASGDTIYEKSAGVEGAPLEVIKLPPDVSLTDAAAMYLTGISKLSGPEAALLLNGSWDLDIDRSKGTNISIHYADFTSKTLSSAIQRAMEAEKLNETEMAESGEDDSGNTYSSGNITVGDSTYAWKISAIPLSEIYSIAGLPEDAVYVGIRITS